MIEQIKFINDVEIKFKIKPRKYDTQHLIVIFSGFGSSGEFTYDFENALMDCPASILWIKDDFEGHCTYYTCLGMDFKIEKAINIFIDETLNSLNLMKSQCTVAGFSKGGTAAIYYGVKYNYKNIVSTVPQFYIGSYVKKNWPAVANHMMNGISEEYVNTLNNLLPDTIDDDKELQKNIYLLTSEADDQFKSEVSPNLSKFIKYDNFNYLLSKSILVRAHNQVTVHNLPLLLGVFYSIAQGAVPRFGYCELGGDELRLPENPSAKPLTVLKKIRIDKGRFYPEGLSVLRGISCENHKDLKVKMILSSNDNIIEIDLAKAHMPYLTRALYDGTFVNYDKGWFCSPTHSGFNIDIVASGEYEIELVVTCQGITKKNNLTIDAHMNNKLLAEGEGMKIFAKDGSVFLYKN